ILAVQSFDNGSVHISTGLYIKYSVNHIILYRCPLLSQDTVDLFFYFILMNVDDHIPFHTVGSPSSFFVEHGEVAKFSVFIKVKLTRYQPIVFTWGILGGSKTSSHCFI